MKNGMRLLIGALLIVSPLSSVTQAGQQEARGRADISDFVRGIHVEGSSYDAAKAYTSEDLGILLDMLQRVDDAQYWPNITMVLGATGDPAMVQPLINCVHGRDGYTGWSTAVYRGRASAITALGYLVHESGNVSAMKYLLESVDPQIWIQREIPWLLARDNAERVRVQLSTSAILALALTGQEDAANRLHELMATEGVPARLRQVAESVLPDWERINESGLSAYYRTDEKSTPLAATAARR